MQKRLLQKKNASEDLLMTPAKRFCSSATDNFEKELKSTCTSESTFSPPSIPAEKRPLLQERNGRDISIADVRNTKIFWNQIIMFLIIKYISSTTLN